MRSGACRALVKCLKFGLLLRRHVLVGDDDEVHVAIGVGVADGERALQVSAAEAVAENLRGPDHKLDQ